MIIPTLSLHSPKKGYALATILVLLGVVIFSAGAIISVSILESKISRSEQEGIKAYYVAEAGVNDALWRLNHTSSYSSALQANTLNITYTATNVPSTGQGYTVVLKNIAPGADYAQVDVTSYSTNNTFTARRHIIANVFQGPPVLPGGTNAVMGGQSVSISNNDNVPLNITGDLYGGTVSLSPSSAGINLGTNKILTPGTYSGPSSGTVTNGGISASNYPPAATTLPVPGFAFSSYTQSSGCTNYYSTPSNFQSYVTSNLVNNSITLNGPVTCIDGGGVNFNWASGDTINVTGMLIILNGGIQTVGNVSTFVLNVNDPGNGKSGVFANGSIHNIKGTWNINGVVYTSSDIKLNNSPGLTINGALIAGTTIDIASSSQVNLNYVASRVNGVGFTGGTPSAVQVQHFEDQY